MGTTITDHSFIGKGTIYLGPYADDAKRRPIGNVSALSFSVSEEKKELMDYQNAGGGYANTIRRITGVEFSMTLLDFHPENAAMVLYGSTAAVAATPVSAEAHTAYQGGLLPTAKIVDTAQTVTVNGSGGTPTYVEGDDYIVQGGGIFIVEGGGISDATAIEISYTPKAGNLVQAMVNSGRDWRFTFDGLNEAQSGRSTVLRVHRAKFGAAQNIGIIGDEFNEMQVGGDVLKDAAVTGSGLSQYFEWEFADAA